MHEQQIEHCGAENGHTLSEGKKQTDKQTSKSARGQNTITEVICAGVTRSHQNCEAICEKSMTSIDVATFSF